jgi:hypothetical protein
VQALIVSRSRMGLAPLVWCAVSAIVAGCRGVVSSRRHAERATVADSVSPVVVDTVGPARLRVVSDEADAAISVIEAHDSVVALRAWRHVVGSEGYWALRQREAAIHRPFTDSSFEAYLRSDSTARRAPVIRATLSGWQHADITDAVRRAAAYLPSGTAFRATLYFEVKPRLNTFVFRTDSGPSIFVAIDPSVRAGKFSNELAHELHHIGYEAACAGQTDTTQATPRQVVGTWMSAFGEGWAMLAAAGGPTVDPHASDDSADRAVWRADYARVGDDLRRLDRFVRDVLDRRLASRDTIERTAMTFFGPVQGPWYTVGYLMVSTVETAEGHAALMRVLCDPIQLTLTYQRIARERDARGEHLPLWSDDVIRRLTPGAITAARKSAVPPHGDGIQSLPRPRVTRAGGR